MAEAPHGTAPRLHGKNVANPLAMILAAAARAFVYRRSSSARRVARDLRRGARRLYSEGIATADLGGHATTTEFTDAVIARLSP